MQMKGVTVPDGKVEEFVKKIILEYKVNGCKDLTYTVSSSLIIDTFRVAIKEKQIRLKDIQIFFDNGVEVDLIPFDENARTNFWPTGFCDVFEKTLMKLI